MECWWIGNDSKPQWVQDLIDRKLLKHHPTHIVDCYTLKQTLQTTAPTYLYEGDGLCYCDNKIGVIYNLYKNFEEVKRSVPVIKYYCDMCEEEVFDKDDMYEMKLSKKDDDYGTTSVLIRKDICENCFNKIVDFIKEKNKH